MKPETKNTPQNNPSIALSCVDGPGILQDVTTFFAKRACNFTDFRQDTVPGENGGGTRLFLRAEWEGLTEGIEEVFQQDVGRKHGMRVQFDLNQKPKRIGLWCSQYSHCVHAVLSAVESGSLPAEVPYVLGNHEQVADVVTGFGRKTGTTFKHLPMRSTMGRRDLADDQAYVNFAREAETDVIGLARYMRFITKEMMREVGQPIINVHHGLLPAFKGAEPHKQAFKRGVRIVGATAHFATEDLDEGPIIAQEVKKLGSAASAENIRKINMGNETNAFVSALRLFVQNRIIMPTSGNSRPHIFEE